MKRKKLRITEADYLKANRRASRQEEIDSHGHPVQGRAMIHKSKKVYDRNRMKRAAIKIDDSSPSRTTASWLLEYLPLLNQPIPA